LAKRITVWKEMFEYNADTGGLIWRPRLGLNDWNTRWAGKVAGSIHKRRGKSACVQVRVADKVIKAHRIIWEMNYGAIPGGFHIDHIDTNGTNNRLSNLRLATDSQNKFNVKKRRNNTSGFKGVTWNRRSCKWRAQIKAHGKAYNLGNHDSIGLAALAYAKAALRLHGKFARLT